MNEISLRYRATGLKDELRKQGRMQRWVARQAQISDALMSYIVSGEKTASPEVAERIAQALGVSLFLLFESTSVYENFPEREQVPA